MLLKRGTRGQRASVRFVDVDPAAAELHLVLGDHGVPRLAHAPEDDEGLAARAAVLGRDEVDGGDAALLEESRDVRLGDREREPADAKHAPVAAVAPLRHLLRPVVRLPARRREDLDVAAPPEPLAVLGERARRGFAVRESEEAVARRVVDEDRLLLGAGRAGAQQELADVLRRAVPRQAPEPDRVRVGARLAAARRRAQRKGRPLLVARLDVEALDRQRGDLGLLRARNPRGGLEARRRRRRADGPTTAALLLLARALHRRAGLPEDRQGLGDRIIASGHAPPTTSLRPDAASHDRASVDGHAAEEPREEADSRRFLEDPAKVGGKVAPPLGASATGRGRRAGRRRYPCGSPRAVATWPPPLPLPRRADRSPRGARASPPSRAVATVKSPAWSLALALDQGAVWPRGLS